MHWSFHSNISVTLYVSKSSTEILRNPAWEIIWVFLCDLYKLCLARSNMLPWKEFMYLVRASFLRNELQCVEILLRRILVLVYNFPYSSVPSLNCGKLELVIKQSI
jgi:hypothetical protein